MTPDEAKEAAAREALKHVRDGMKLGLGTGSTAAKFVAGLGEMVAQGLNVVCVPTSEATRKQAESLNIPLSRLDEEPILDLTVDGADELDADLDRVPGGEVDGLGSGTGFGHRERHLGVRLGHHGGVPAAARDQEERERPQISLPR